MIILDDQFDYRDQLLDAEILCDLFDRTFSTDRASARRNYRVSLADVGIRGFDHPHLRDRTTVMIKFVTGGVAARMHSIIPANLHDTIIFYVSASSKTPKVAVVLPTVNDRKANGRDWSPQWVSYMIDTTARTLVNAGPVNGTHMIVSMMQPATKFDKTKTLVNLRINEDGTFSIPSGDGIIIYRAYPERGVHFKVRLSGYTLTDNGPTFRRASLGVCTLDKEPELLPSKFWKKHQIVADFTKPFPLEADELVIATMGR